MHGDRPQNILISACLLGEMVRYDGQCLAVESEILQKWYNEGRLLSICPEMAGGLPVPRTAAEIQAGDGTDVLAGRRRVKTKDGQDVTEAFLIGATKALKLAKLHDCRFAILSERSPSCGHLTIYNGEFKGQKILGVGVTAALLASQGIQVFNQFEIEELQRCMDG